MRLISKLILIVLIVNIVTAGVARIVFSRRLKVTREFLLFDMNKARPVVLLVAGMMNQATKAFSFSRFEGYDICYLNFSMFGFNPRLAGRQIRELYKEGDVVLGISIGAKAAVYSGETEQILINPCVFPETLQLKLRLPIKIFAPLIEFVSYGLGWLAILPVIPADSGRYSLALLADQLFAIGYGEPNRQLVEEGNIKGVVLSIRDEFLDNDVIEKTFSNSEIVWIFTKHGRTTEAGSKGYYRLAVEKFLDRPRV